MWSAADCFYESVSVAIGRYYYADVAACSGHRWRSRTLPRSSEHKHMPMAHKGTLAAAGRAHYGELRCLRELQASQACWCHAWCEDAGSRRGCGCVIIDRLAVRVLRYEARTFFVPVRAEPQWSVRVMRVL